MSKRLNATIGPPLRLWTTAGAPLQLGTMAMAGDVIRTADQPGRLRIKRVKDRHLFVVVNRQVVIANAKHHKADPVLRISFGPNGAPVYATEVKFPRGGSIRYSPDKPLTKCGARLALVTDVLRIVR